MRVRKNSGKNFMGGYFSSLQSSLCGSQQTLDHAGDQCVQCLLTVFFIKALLNGIHNVNFWEVCFPSHLYVSYMMTGLESQPSTPWTVFGRSVTRKHWTFFDLQKKERTQPFHFF